MVFACFSRTPMWWIVESMAFGSTWLFFVAFLKLYLPCFPVDYCWLWTFFFIFIAKSCKLPNLCWPSRPCAQCVYDYTCISDIGIYRLLFPVLATHSNPNCGSLQWDGTVSKDQLSKTLDHLVLIETATKSKGGSVDSAQLVDTVTTPAKSRVSGVSPVLLG